MANLQSDASPDTNVIEKITTSYKPLKTQLDLFAVPVIKPLTLEETEELNNQRQALENKYSLTDIFSNATDTEWLSSNYLRNRGQDQLMPDPNFKPTEETYKDIVTEFNIPTHYISELSEAHSAAHLRQLASQIKEISDKEDIINSKGIATGLTARILAAVVDPVAFGAIIATEGALSPLIFANKLNRIQKMVRGGIAGATTNVALESFLASQNPTITSEHVLYAGILGFGLGGVLSGIGSGVSKEQRAFNKVAQEMRNEQARLDVEGTRDIEFTEKGKRQTATDPNAEFYSTRTVEDAENPVDTLKGINRVDGRTEHKIDDDLEIIVSEPDEEGLFEIRKCA